MPLDIEGMEKGGLSVVCRTSYAVVGGQGSGAANKEKTRCKRQEQLSGEKLRPTIVFLVCALEEPNSSLLRGVCYAFRWRGGKMASDVQ